MDVAHAELESEQAVCSEPDPLAEPLRCGLVSLIAGQEEEAPQRLARAERTERLERRAAPLRS